MPPAISQNLPTERTSSPNVVAERTKDTGAPPRAIREPHEANPVDTTTRPRRDPIELQSDTSLPPHPPTSPSNKLEADEQVKSEKNVNSAPSLSVIGKELNPDNGGSSRVWQLTYVLNYDISTVDDLLEVRRWFERSLEELGYHSEDDTVNNRADIVRFGGIPEDAQRQILTILLWPLDVFANAMERVESRDDRTQVAKATKFLAILKAYLYSMFAPALIGFLQEISSLLFETHVISRTNLVNEDLNVERRFSHPGDIFTVMGGSGCKGITEMACIDTCILVVQAWSKNDEEEAINKILTELRGTTYYNHFRRMIAKNFPAHSKPFVDKVRESIDANRMAKIREANELEELRAWKQAQEQRSRNESALVISPVTAEMQKRDSDEKSWDAPRKMRLTELVQTLKAETETAGAKQQTSPRRKAGHWEALEGDSQKSEQGRQEQFNDDVPRRRYTMQTPEGRDAFVNDMVQNAYSRAHTMAANVMAKQPRYSTMDIFRPSSGSSGPSRAQDVQQQRRTSTGGTRDINGIWSFLKKFDRSI